MPHKLMAGQRRIWINVYTQLIASVHSHYVSQGKIPRNLSSLFHFLMEDVCRVLGIQVMTLEQAEVYLYTVGFQRPEPSSTAEVSAVINARMFKMVNLRSLVSDEEVEEGA